VQSFSSVVQLELALTSESISPHQFHPISSLVDARQRFCFAQFSVWFSFHSSFLIAVRNIYRAFSILRPINGSPSLQVDENGQIGERGRFVDQVRDREIKIDISDSDQK